MPARINPFPCVPALALLTIVAAAERASASLSDGRRPGYHERRASRHGVVDAQVSGSALSILGMAVIGLLILAHLTWIVERNDDLDGTTERSRG